MSSPGSILYVTADGLLEPIGFSQVVRVVEGLARRGWAYEIISLERRQDLEDAPRLRALRDRLASSGITWRFLPYLSGGTARQAVLNEFALVRAVVSRARRGNLAAVHARAYHGAMAALVAWCLFRTPFLFDARSYWFDERIEDGRWFTSPVRLGVARAIERRFFVNATAVVTLTDLQASDVRSGKFGVPPRVVQCITTCADYDEFGRRPIEGCSGVPQLVRAQLMGGVVLGIVGSINRSYLIDESLQLAKLVIDRDARSRLLILSRQRREFSGLVEKAGIPADRVFLALAAHDDMPQWLSLIDWGLLLLNPSSPAKRASMPTKLAEFFASGVRPVQFGCNEEVSAWVRKTGSGLVLEDVSGPALAAAAERIVATPRDESVVERAREIAATHFSLASGLTKYGTVLRAMCPGSGGM